MAASEFGTPTTNSSGSGSTATPTITLPASIPAGALIVITVAHTNSATHNSWSAGYAQKFLVANSTAESVAVYTKVATGGETTFSLTLSSATVWNVVARVFEGYELDAVHSTTTNAGTNQPSSSMTATKAPGLAFAFAAGRGAADGSAVTFTPPAGYTAQVQNTSTRTTTNRNGGLTTSLLAKTDVNVASATNVANQSLSGVSGHIFLIESGALSQVSAARATMWNIAQQVQASRGTLWNVNTLSNGLTWAPPELVTPTTITLTNSSRKAIMDPTKDYIIKVQGTTAGTPFDASGGIELNGGRNVVLIGGKIQFSQLYSAGVDSALGTSNRGLFIKGNSAQTVPRVVHVEGLYFAGSYFFEGINIDAQSEPGLTVRVQNCRMDQINTLLPGDGSHQGGDGIQCYNGPATLQVDKFTLASAGYQGFFLQPKQFGSGPVSTYTFKRVNMDGSTYASPAMAGHTNPQLGNNTSAYLVWHSNPSTVPLVVENLYLKKNPSKAWPGGVVWPTDNAVWGALQGDPPGGDYVPASLWDTGYVSPGYITDAPGLTSVLALRATTWNVFKQIQQSRATKWNVQQTITAARAALWNVRKVVSSERATGWHVMQLITRPQGVRWNVLKTVAVPRATKWNVLVSVAASRATKWNVLKLVQRARSTSWNNYIRMPFAIGKATATVTGVSRTATITRPTASAYIQSPAGDAD